MKAISLFATAIFLPAIAMASVKPDLTEKLSKKDQLQVIVSNIRQIWNDGNITTGTSVVSAVSVKAELPEKKKDWEAFGDELFAETFQVEQNESLPKSAKLKVQVAAAEPIDIETVVDAVAEANDYAPENEEGRNDIRRQTWKMVRTLGDLENLKFVSITTRLKDDTTKATRNVRLNAFVNTINKKAILIFTIEGTM